MASNWIGLIISRVSPTRPSQPERRVWPSHPVTDTDLLACSVNLAAVDALTSQPFLNLAITPSSLTLRPSLSPFHTLKASLAATRSATSLPRKFRLLLSVANASRVGDKGKAVAEGEQDDERIKQVTGEVGQGASESWEEDRFVFLRALSGEVDVRETKAGENAVADTKGEQP